MNKDNNYLRKRIVEEIKQREEFRILVENGRIEQKRLQSQ